MDAQCKILKKQESSPMGVRVHVATASALVHFILVSSVGKKQRDNIFPQINQLRRIWEETNCGVGRHIQNPGSRREMNTLQSFLSITRLHRCMCDWRQWQWKGGQKLEWAWKQAGLPWHFKSVTEVYFSLLASYHPSLKIPNRLWKLGMWFP